MTDTTLTALAVVLLLVFWIGWALGVQHGRERARWP